MNQNNGKKQKKRLNAEETCHIYQECEQPEARVKESLVNMGCTHRISKICRRWKKKDRWSL